MRVVHFDINAEDPARAVAFYKDVFGWEIQKWDGPTDYWLVTTGACDQPGGINGGVCRGEMRGGFTNTIGVPSIEEYTAKIEAKGGKVVHPKMAIPGVGYLAYCKDTEGNVFGIMQFDKMAG